MLDVYSPIQRKLLKKGLKALKKAGPTCSYLFVALKPEDAFGGDDPKQPAFLLLLGTPETAAKVDLENIEYPALKKSVLSRVGVKPDPSRVSTGYARKVGPKIMFFETPDASKGFAPSKFKNAIADFGAFWAANDLPEASLLTKARMFDAADLSEEEKADLQAAIGKVDVDETDPDAFGAAVVAAVLAQARLFRDTPAMKDLALAARVVADAVDTVEEVDRQILARTEKKLLDISALVEALGEALPDLDAKAFDLGAVYKAHLALETALVGARDDLEALARVCELPWTYDLEAAGDWLQDQEKDDDLRSGFPDPDLEEHPDLAHLADLIPGVIVGDEWAVRAAAAFEGLRSARGEVLVAVTALSKADETARPGAIAALIDAVESYSQQIGSFEQAIAAFFQLVTGLEESLVALENHPFGDLGEIHAAATKVKSPLSLYKPLTDGCGGLTAALATHAHDVDAFGDQLA